MSTRILNKSLTAACQTAYHHHNGIRNWRRSTEILNGIQIRNMAGECSFLTVDNMNPHVKTMEYAVRGPLVIRASEIEKEILKVVPFCFFFFFVYSSVYRGVNFDLAASYIFLIRTY